MVSCLFARTWGVTHIGSGSGLSFGVGEVGCSGKSRRRREAGIERRRRPAQRERAPVWTRVERTSASVISSAKSRLAFPCTQPHWQKCIEERRDCSHCYRRSTHCNVLGLLVAQYTASESFTKLESCFAAARSLDLNAQPP